MSELQSLKELINHRFDSTDSRLDGLTDEVKVTNGRLRGAEVHIANIQPRLETLEREMGHVRRSLKAPDHQATTDAGEQRVLRAWHVGAAVAIVLGTIAVLKFFGRLQ